MKKTFTTLVAVLAIAQFSYAQSGWTTTGLGTTTTDNVGIGTTSLPSGGKLQVSGPIDNITVNGSGVFRIYDGVNFAGGFGTDAWAHAGSNTDLAVFTSHNLYLSSGGLKRMTLLSSGYVGIGTTSPVVTLDVNGGINIPNGSSFTWGGAYGAGIPTIGANNTAGFVFYPGGSTSGESMRITPSGYVGIGTTTPHEALSVNGDIRSKQVKVEAANWPDYVFKSTYVLPSLSEVKTYIDKYQHLPDMPSEAEVTKDGLNLGEMNRLLLKKVEELTLYLIDKDKQVNSLQSEVVQLKTAIKAINKALAKDRH